MPIGASLRRALETFAAAEREIVRMGRTVDGSTAMEFVRIRKQLAEEFGTLGLALEADPWLRTHPEILHEGQRFFAAFRTQNSVNQADWPAVRVKDDRDTYQTAVRPLIEKSGAFWRWAEAALGFRP